MVDVLTKHVTRDKLARMFKVPEVVKLIENLTRDVGTSLPDSVNANAEAISAAEAAAVSAQESATAAQNAAQYVETLQHTIQTQASAISALKSEVADLRKLIEATSWR